VFLSESARWCCHLVPVRVPEVVLPPCSCPNLPFRESTPCPCARVKGTPRPKLKAPRRHRNRSLFRVFNALLVKIAGNLPIRSIRSIRSINKVNKVNNTPAGPSPCRQGVRGEIPDGIRLGIGEGEEGGIGEEEEGCSSSPGLRL